MTTSKVSSVSSYHDDHKRYTRMKIYVGILFTHIKIIICSIYLVHNI